VLSPEMRDLRRLLRYRQWVVAQAVRRQNKMAGLLMETGAPFVKSKLHGKKYFTQRLETLEEVPESVKDLLRMSRGALEMFESTQQRLVKRLLHEPRIAQGVERLASIPAVGPITALTGALEIVAPLRFPSIGDAVSYCGLTAAFRPSAGKEQRGPLSKQRNHWLQTALIEAAKRAPCWNPRLAAVYQREIPHGHAHRATLPVARQLVAYLLAVDQSGQPFQLRHSPGPLEGEATGKEEKEKMPDPAFAPA
jgi:transposase